MKCKELLEAFVLWLREQKDERMDCSYDIMYNIDYYPDSVFHDKVLELINAFCEAKEQ
jgi:hypothetical protein